MDIKNKIKLLKVLYAANKTKDLDCCDIDALFFLAGLENQFYYGINKVLKTLSKEQCVLFAYNCALSVVCFLEPKSRKKEKTIICLNTVNQWLKNPKSISLEQLKKEANIASLPAAMVAYAAPNKHEQVKKNLEFLLEVL